MLALSNIYKQAKKQVFFIYDFKKRTAYTPLNMMNEQINEVGSE